MVPPAEPKPLAPAQALELRLRWLEAILYGARSSVKPTVSSAETIARRAGELQRRMNEVVGAHDSLRRFVDYYAQHAHLLTPAFALSGTLPAPPAYADMAPAEFDAFLSELEPDVRAAERDMREIAVLEDKGVTGAGRLPDYEALQPRLDALLVRHAEDARRAAMLEARIAAVVQHYASQVDELSEVFVEWDEVLREAEERVGKLEREKAERARLGYE
ncbi:hypothetical protein K488DRAFT_50182 [Vararia minispora EC-137]|uniref:Uncharacterized protein n=1 Tax=Vararia minispora EC-137 TaxID=1314806 RepID=A0ACB8QKV6_9AGAM|nr:hypothetical protein K488DRAFT_50182 [Vararia minispora EC-137]